MLSGAAWAATPYRAVNPYEAQPQQPQEKSTFSPSVYGDAACSTRKPSLHISVLLKLLAVGPDLPKIRLIPDV